METGILPSDVRLIQPPVCFGITMTEHLSARELIARGKYDWVDPVITEMLPGQPILFGWAELYLLYSGQNMIGIGAEEALIDAARRGLRSSGANLLLCLGMLQPELQRRGPITALGTSSVFLDRDDEPRVLTLSGDADKRVLKADYYNTRFGRNTRFLCEPE